MAAPKSTPTAPTATAATVATTPITSFRTRTFSPTVVERLSSVRLIGRLRAIVEELSAG
ncbi:uncharacterized protein RMCT_1815 [Mycolicibacterium thermoresistibile]|uniref:Uncharacterized protein n=1 Tax=Mycolicibacterium thermoresistibile TaxID=1797 RepID=A0A117IM92_MYCTH|nr:uncharacterized protein RMCT_1815 [Mycolicibacterium thermoresistibile]